MVPLLKELNVRDIVQWAGEQISFDVNSRESECRQASKVMLEIRIIVCITLPSILFAMNTGKRHIQHFPICIFYFLSRRALKIIFGIPSPESSLKAFQKFSIHCRRCHKYKSCSLCFGKKTRSNLSSSLLSPHFTEKFSKGDERKRLQFSSAKWTSLLAMNMENKSTPSSIKQRKLVFHIFLLFSPMRPSASAITSRFRSLPRTGTPAADEPQDTTVNP